MKPEDSAVTLYYSARPVIFFFFNDTATTEIYTLSLHDALPILLLPAGQVGPGLTAAAQRRDLRPATGERRRRDEHLRSEEHTSELQSRQYLVCRLLLEKKKKINQEYTDAR